MIRYKCNICGAEMESPDSAEGQKEVCPNCKEPRRVPKNPSPRQSKSRSKILPIIVALSVVVVVVGFLFAIKLARRSEREQERTQKQSEQFVEMHSERAKLTQELKDMQAGHPSVPPKGKTVVEAWLEAQRIGESGNKYWCDREAKASLFAVRSWEILKDTEDGKRKTVTVRIDSSTKGGFRTTNIWKITLVYENKRWGIYSINSM